MTEHISLQVLWGVEAIAQHQFSGCTLHPPLARWELEPCVANESRTKKLIVDPNRQIFAADKADLWRSFHLEPRARTRRPWIANCSAFFSCTLPQTPATWLPWPLFLGRHRGMLKPLNPTQIKAPKPPGKGALFFAS